MKKLALISSIIGLAGLLSCNRTNFSNHKDVIKSYRALANKNENDKL